MRLLTVVVLLQFLDFSKFPEWSKRFIKSIEPTPGKSSVEKGDTLHVVLDGMAMNPTVLVGPDNSHTSLYSREPYICLCRRTQVTNSNGGETRMACLSGITRSVSSRVRKTRDLRLSSTPKTSNA